MAKNGDVPNGDVLVVEDDAQLNELVGAYVELAGFQYRRALDGRSALAAASERPPAMVILDLMLPDIDGFEVCKRLRSSDKTSQTPVLMLTALSQDEHRRRGMECGATGYMTKPFDPDELMEKIRETTKKD
jgi:two-component system alkaline phosphatase synthesis response regulator PhoP